MELEHEPENYRFYGSEHDEHSDTYVLNNEKFMCRKLAIKFPDFTQLWSYFK